MSSERSWKRDLLGVAAALVIAVALPGAGVILLGEELLDRADQWFPASFGGIALLLVVGALVPAFGLVPSHLVSGIAGLVHGIAFGFPIAMAALLMGVLMGQALGRFGLGGNVERLAARMPRLELYREALSDTTSRRGTVAITVLRLSPLFPYAATNLFLGALELPWWRILLGSLFGLAPRVMILVAAGSGIEQLAKGSQTTAIVTGVLAVVSLIALTWFARRMEASITREMKQRTSAA